MSRLVLLTGIALTVLLVLHLIPSDQFPSPLQSRIPSSSSQHAAGDSENQSPKSKFDWSQAKQFHPPGSIKPMPAGPLKKMGRVQAPNDAFVQTDETKKRQRVVRDAFKKSYNAYRTYAWMKDELLPVSASFKNPFGGWAATLVDSLDTLWIMDLRDEFREGAKAVSGIDWSDTKDGAANMFETTIRHLGGLLSAYDLSGDKALLNKAVELAEMLYHGFDTPNRLPPFWLNYQQAKRGELVAGTNDPSASPASLCVEFTRLSQITGDSKYYDATDRVTRFLLGTQNHTSLPGMWPIALDFRNEAVHDDRFTLGALSDSLYEYFPKMHALMGGVDPVYEQMYRTSMETAIQNLLFRPMLPGENDVLFTGDYHASGEEKLIPESQHLTCFVGGLFGLGGRLFNIDEHVSLGERLARGCGWAYSAFPTGVMPEIFRLIPCKDMRKCPWDESIWLRQGGTSLPKGFVNAKDPQYQLRPEAIESIFILYRITGKKELQDLAWDMFQAILTSTETKFAFSAISDVTTTGKTKKVDSMEVRGPFVPLCPLLPF
jgi:mannosyl-oligosaccharide alpha-1,2-mannosidase